MQLRTAAGAESAGYDFRNAPKEIPGSLVSLETKRRTAARRHSESAAVERSWSGREFPEPHPAASRPAVLAMEEAEWVLKVSPGTAATARNKKSLAVAAGLNSEPAELLSKVPQMPAWGHSAKFRAENRPVPVSNAGPARSTVTRFQAKLRSSARASSYCFAGCRCWHFLADCIRQLPASRSGNTIHFPSTAEGGEIAASKFD